VLNDLWGNFIYRPTTDCHAGRPRSKAFIKLLTLHSRNVRQAQCGCETKRDYCLHARTNLGKQVGDGFTVRDEVMRELNTEMDSASRNAISAKGFELEARRIARLMKEKHNIGFVDVVAAGIRTLRKAARPASPRRPF
jgi:hypothetical protein